MGANVLTRQLSIRAVCVVFAGLLLLAYFLIQELGTKISGEPGSSQDRLRQIAYAYINYSYQGGKVRQLEAKPGDTTHSAAVVLAKETGLNDAALYFINDDPRAPETRPTTVLLKMEGPGSPAGPNPDFMKAVLGVEIAANLSPNAPPASTPLAWTRGLRDDGTWAPDSPYKGAGGHIVFLDGHVEWFDKLTLAPSGDCLTIYGTRPNGGKPTVNIREALPPGAVILSAEPAKTGH